MDHGLIGRILVLICSIIGLAFYLYRTYRGRERVGKRAIIKYIIGFILVIIAAALAIDRPFTWMQRVACVIALYYSSLFFYLATDQFINSKLRQPYMWYFIGAFLIFSILETGLIYIERDNLGSFVDNESFHPTWSYYSYYACIYIVVIVMDILSILLLLDGFERSEELGYQIRCLSGTVIFATNLAWLMLGESAILLAVLGIQRYQQINEVFQATRAIPFVIILIALIPTDPLLRLVPPLTYALERRQAYRYTQIAALHDILTRITESPYRVPVELHSFRRLLIEVIDARALLWSQTPHKYPLHPEDEARVIHKRLQERSVITTFGPFALQPKRCNGARYNLAVVRHLRRLGSSIGVRTHNTMESV